MNDKKRIENFLKDFSFRLSKKFGKDIDFILLFGSAARGEWKRGISDIDLIIQARNQKEVKEIEKKAEEIFWNLDKKHNTKFKEVCSIGKKRDPITQFLSQTKLYVPFQVFGPNDISWSRGEIVKKDLIIAAKLVACQSMIFQNMKNEGKILYGRDITKEIDIKVDWWEKIKALLVPFYIACFSILISLILPKTALKLADKSVIYSIGSTFFFLDKPLGKSLKRNTKKIEKEIKDWNDYKLNFFLENELDFLLRFDYYKLVNLNLAKKAIRIKYNWAEESKKFNRWEVLKFCTRSLLFVNSINWYAILKADKNRIILKLLIIFRIILLLLIIIFLIYLFR